MSTSYFILSKQKSDDATDNSKNVVLQPPQEVSYLLPRNLMSCYVDNGLFEARLIEWCKQFCKEDGIFLDIGAHTGSYALTLASYAEHVYAFEPQKMTYYALCGGVALTGADNITCMNVGLGSIDQVGKQTLHIVSNDGGGSTIQDTTSNILRQEEIEIVTLDSLQLSNICFIKMDVEENELSVLKGARSTLVRSALPKIIFECNDEVDNEDLFAFIESLSYKITPIEGIQNMFLAYV